MEFAKLPKQWFVYRTLQNKNLYDTIDDLHWKTNRQAASLT